MNAWWDAKVVGFNFQSQLSILDSLGFDEPGWQQLGWTFASALAAWMLWMTLQLGRTPRGPKPDRVARAYQKLCAKLAAVGLTREPHVGPLAFSDVIRAQRPDVSTSVAPLLMNYALLRFGPSTSPIDVASFERAVSRLRITKRD
jgi:hypothetical protein